MTRGRTGAQITADKAASSGGAILIELLFDSGALRIVVGQWNIVVGADTYFATGGGLSVKALEENADGLEGCEMSLSGLDAGIKALVFAEPYQGKVARILEQRYDADGAAVGDPQAQFVGRMRAMTTSEDPENRTHTVAVICEHFDADFEEPSDLRNTEAEQKRRFPTDLGCEHLASLQDRVIARKPKTP
jgi:hypothetical protein